MMRSPYYEITTRCWNDKCCVETFITERKRITYKATDGREKPCERIVCPNCRTWGNIIETKEVLA